ncbi:MAG TPA: long-chain fatty acid--CoA ligase [Acidimicrobiales bacterium]|nr:long-chain fatty acid--CoA ligase [Acidimicrobiales bacterium]
MRSTMQEAPLLVREILRHGAQVYPTSEVVTFEGDHFRRASFAEVAARAAQLAHGLAELGIGQGDRVGTFCFNHQEHVEAYFAIPSMGAVLHTLNIRLFPEQLKYVIDHAGDRVILCDAAVAPLLARVVGECESVERIVVVGEGDTSAFAPLGRLAETTAYEDLLAGRPEQYDWPVLDEHEAAAMCYTSGTTGNPKGVSYSHRSTYLHSLASTSAATLGISSHDRALVVVPQFHANAWGMPYSAWLSGADLIMPKQFLQAEPLVKIIEAERPTFAGAVPTIWNDVLRYAESHGSDLSCFRSIVCGGSAVPRSLMERFEERYGVPIIQAWGMTETSPLGSVAIPPRGAEGEDAWAYRTKAGRAVFGVEVRVVDGTGAVAPRDGRSVGEFEVRGPWVTGSYQGDPSPERFHDGWLRTGDVGTVDELGYLTITDRTKDVIKTGGEWISSVELENVLMGHPAVFEAAVVAIPDERWDERPLACVVLHEGASATPAELAAYLSERVARWWVPERWAFVAEVPKTSVGKFDKKVLRAQLQKGELEVLEREKSS